MAWAGVLPHVLVAAAVLLVPVAFPGFVYPMTTALIYATLTVGLNTVFGLAGELSLAQAAMFGIGAYSAAIGTANFGLGLVTTVPVALVLTGALSLAVGYPSLRLRGHHFVIVTFAFAELIRLVLVNSQGLTGGVQGISVPRAALSVRIGGSELDLKSEMVFYYLSAVVMLAGTLLYLCVRKSAWGDRLQAIRGNDILARSLGINVMANKLWVFVLASQYGAVAGWLFALQLGHIEPSVFDVHLAIRVPLMLIIGGVATVYGPLVGAATVVFLPEVIRLSPIMSQVVFGALLVVVILVTPRGLLPGLRLLQRAMQRPRPLEGLVRP